MSNEKMQILKMLEERKISAEEASRLLAACESSGSPRASSSSTSSSTTSSSYHSQQSPNSDSHSKSSAAGFDEFAYDIGKKLETFARDMEPKLQKFAEVVVEKTAVAADKISKNMNEAYQRGSEKAERARTTYSSPSPSPSHSPSANGSRVENNFEISVIAGYNELNLKALNGDISVKGYNGDKITTRVYVEATRAGARIELIKLGNKYQLSYNEDEFRSVSVDALVPERLFNIVRISGENGRSTVSNLQADDIKIDSTNGKIKVSEVYGEKLLVIGLNGDANISNIDIENFEINTANSPVYMEIPEYARYNNYVWKVETSNGVVNMNLPSLPTLGYHLKADTSLGNVNIGLTGLNFTENNRGCAEARSVNFSSAQKQVNIKVETSNDGITIN